MPDATHDSRRYKPLNAADQRRLLDVAVRRLEGQTWREIADAMPGWNCKQAAHSWSTYALARWHREGENR